MACDKCKCIFVTDPARASHKDVVFLAYSDRPRGDFEFDPTTAAQPF